LAGLGGFWFPLPEEPDGRYLIFPLKPASVHAVPAALVNVPGKFGTTHPVVTYAVRIFWVPPAGAVIVRVTSKTPKFLKVC
jgi:hypothetical protein